MDFPELGRTSVVQLRAEHIVPEAMGDVVLEALGTSAGALRDGALITIASLAAALATSGGVVLGQDGSATVVLSTLRLLEFNFRKCTAMLLPNPQPRRDPHVRP